MDIHKNARLTPHGRERIVRRVLSGQTLKAVAEAAGVCPGTVRKWVARYRAEGLVGLKDRSSRPHRLYRPTPSETVSRIETLRRQRRPGAHIAKKVGVSPATVSRVLKRLGLNKLKALDLPEPVRRYERAHPGEMIHIDIKKLGKFSRTGHRITSDRKGQSNSRGIGWEYMHLAIDDHSRVACLEILPDEKRRSCLGFIFNALRFFRTPGVRVHRVMTDCPKGTPRVNGTSFRSYRYAKALRMLKIKHIRTKPYTPKTNGKAERFVQTALREWAYARAYDTSDRRADNLPIWLHRYNWHRPHGSLKANTPIGRLALTEDNLLRLHS